MSENPKNDPHPNDLYQNTTPQIIAQQLGRRLFVFKAAAVLGGVAAAALGASLEAHADPGFGHQDKGAKSDKDSTDASTSDH